LLSLIASTERQLHATAWTPGCPQGRRALESSPTGGEAISIAGWRGDRQFLDASTGIIEIARLWRGVRACSDRARTGSPWQIGPERPLRNLQRAADYNCGPLPSFLPERA
jgi:hypothetical protein